MYVIAGIDVPAVNARATTCNGCAETVASKAFAAIGPTINENMAIAEATKTMKRRIMFFRLPAASTSFWLAPLDRSSRTRRFDVAAYFR